VVRVRDVVMIDADLEQVYSLDEVPADMAQGYAMQADWDPDLDAGRRMDELKGLPRRPGRASDKRKSQLDGGDAGPGG
jgi:hypothetical protein